MSAPNQRQIIRASIGQAAVAVDILKEVSIWLEQLGQPLWDPKSLSLSDFERAACAGELLLGYQQNQAVACMLLQRRDVLHWPNDRPGDALYIHKLAVRRRAAGRNWSGFLIDWAIAQARSSGARFLRLNTDPRPQLCSLYQRHGFFRVDETPRRVGAFLAVRFEMRIS